MTTAQLLEQIKTAMHARNLSAADMAAAVGCSAQQLGRWLNGKHAPTVTHLEAMAQVVGLEVCLREHHP